MIPLITNFINTMIMAFTLPLLPYPNNGLEPVISASTIDFHYGKHLQAYVNNLNSLVPGTEFEGKSLEYIVENAPDGGIFNNAGQVLNHTLYFLQFTSKQEKSEPTGKLKEAIDRDFGSYENMKKQLSDASVTLFGSGWAWLSQEKDGKLTIGKYANGDNPLRYGKQPLLGIDVWEHAYYLDFQNRRADHVAKLFEIIDWNVVESRLK